MTQPPRTHALTYCEPCSDCEAILRQAQAAAPAALLAALRALAEAADGGHLSRFTPAFRQARALLRDLSPEEDQGMIDDRYRFNQTSEAILSSFEEVRRDYGREIAVDEQVAICKRLATALLVHSGPLTRSDVLGAFEAIAVRRPPNGFARDLIARLERVVG